VLIGLVASDFGQDARLLFIQTHVETLHATSLLWSIHLQIAVIQNYTCLSTNS
jgi:hypothetical protein